MKVEGVARYSMGFSLCLSIIDVCTIIAESASKLSSDVNSCKIDVKRLKSRYLRLPPTAKTDWPKHKVTHYVRLALIEKEDVTLRDEDLNGITKLTLQGDVGRILKEKKPLGDLKDIFHYENQPCPRLIVIMGSPGEYIIINHEN